MDRTLSKTFICWKGVKNKVINGKYVEDLNVHWLLDILLPEPITNSMIYKRSFKVTCNRSFINFSVISVTIKLCKQGSIIV